MLSLSPKTWEKLKDWILQEIIEKDPDIAAELADFVLEIIRDLPNVSGKASGSGDPEELAQLQLKGIVKNPQEMLTQLPSKIHTVESTEKIPGPTSSVKVVNIPVRNLSRDQIRGQFKPFGSIKYCKISIQKRQAVVQYHNESCAIRCTKATSVIFNNRFVKVELFHGNIEDFEGVTIIPPVCHQKTEQSNTISKQASSSSEQSTVNKRIERVQNVQQILFENNQKSNETYKTDFNELLLSKEKLLRAHQSLLQELQRKTTELSTDDKKPSIGPLLLEFKRIQKSMDELNITPTEMTDIKVRKMNMDHPNEFEVKDARTAAAKKKRAKKLASIRKKIRRKR
ncbi:uncharacterized protein LALA0_S06e01376g [Lachancea lanzarotensis]|uniref:LALA0S06e01376g1_1 n=1 Tax=Lachancea lanzarotensis TaxID=1245769 RepID=A0A0C7NAZ8_9SACH|nr:uncharacterized protein LALA0_S06e01376g [Lachancea lanzarotensis]CEP62687.1 LALA0S06e01376g1_1 [Lachancea lanzarotensis]